MKYIDIVEYPDGTSYYKAPTEAPYYHYARDENWIYTLNSYHDLWTLNQFVDAMNSIGIIPNITIPWLIDGQADRRFNKGESFGLKLVCDFLNRMDANFKIFHPHNREVVEALIDGVEIIEPDNFLKKVLEQISDKNNLVKRLENSLVILSPDAGAYKWVSKICDKIEWAGEVKTASKSRKFNNGKSILTQELPVNNFHGLDILIVDDICVNGGTFVGLAKLLKKAKCGKLFLAISHITVENPNIELSEYFDTIFTTNGIDLNYKIDKIVKINLFE